MPTTPITDRPSNRSRRCLTAFWIVGALMAAFPLIIVQGKLSEVLFGWVPDHPPLVLNILLIPITSLFFLFGFFGYPIGTGILT